MTTRQDTGTFTGRHMLLIMLAFFGIIIGVNVTMATLAGTSWTGFVVRNSYIASQEFNGKVEAAREQIALGWTASLTLDDGTVSLRLADAGAAPIPLSAAELVFRNPASEADDTTIALLPSARGMVGAARLRDGLWVVEIEAVTAEGRVWRETRRIILSDGRFE
jgi:nitrogen fixation protein FixH